VKYLNTVIFALFVGTIAVWVVAMELPKVFTQIVVLIVLALVARLVFSLTGRW
jgi:uncharacterized membrane protein YeaQ/YmgE (transglycosylase-associated protein family)